MYRGAVGHMIRFYLPRSGMCDISGLSPASRTAWEACDRVISNLTGTERKIIEMYYASPYDRERRKDPLKNVSDYYNIPLEDVKAVIDRILRMVAVERGLADE